MRPISVEFAAFGSYPGETKVDFSSLQQRGLFVVTGDTGTGKTTIFDAMSYALFGKMPLKPGDDIRSHHADPSQLTFARFTFEIDGAQYVAERFPEQERPRRKGAGTTTDATKVRLFRVDVNGTTSMATRVTDMNKEINDLIGLSAEQFQRVMVLPQGEIARFLLDNSSDRETLLSALFDGAIYGDIANALKNEAKRLKEEVASVDVEVRHHLANANNRVGELCNALKVDHPITAALAEDGPDEVEPLGRDDLQAFLAFCAEPLEQLRTDAETTAAVAGTDAENHTRAKAAAGIFTRANELRTRLAAIAEELKTIGPQADAARASKRARPVVNAATQLDESETEARSAEEYRQGIVGQIELITADHGLTVRTESAELLDADLNDLASDLRDQQDLVDAVTTAETALSTAETGLTTLREEHDEKEKLLDDAVTKLTELDSQIRDLRAPAESVVSLQEKVADHEAAKPLITARIKAEQAIEGCETKRSSAQRDLDIALERFIATSAPRLAAQLTAGEPCPVCGSPEHPDPATDPNEPVGPDAIAKAYDHVVEAMSDQDEAQATLEGIKTQLGQWAEASASDLKKSLDRARGELTKAEKAAEELNKLEEQRRTTGEDREKAAGQQSELNGLILAAEKAVGTAKSNLHTASEAAKGVNTQQLAAHQTALAELRGLKSDLAGKEKHCATTAEAKRIHAGALRDALTDSGFDDVDSAKAALITDEAVESAAIQSHDELVDEQGTTTAALNALTEQGIPDALPDVAALDETAKASRGISDARSERRTLANNAAEKLSEDLGALDSLTSESESLRRLAEVTDHAQTVCRGQGNTKVSLQRWVLGQELDRVTRAASVHLTQMTGGLYTIARKRESGDGRSVAGLDLEVHDANTGRPRSPRSLSGGEQFQASLALALGLADVVSQGGRGSGRQFEALFVDEGFGALDPAALDDAIESLYQLHASGRMVGVITHVEAMKERLHPGIVVRRLPDGKGSTLQVNP